VETIARKPAGQLRIIGQHGADAHHDRIAATAQGVGGPARASPVIQRLSPVLVAIRPSSVEASFSVTIAAPDGRGIETRQPTSSASVAARLPRP